MSPVADGRLIMASQPEVVGAGHDTGWMPPVVDARLVILRRARRSVLRPTLPETGGSTWPTDLARYSWCLTRTLGATGEGPRQQRVVNFFHFISYCDCFLPAPPSQKFPDEFKRNRQKRTWNTARWILMFLGRLANPAIATKCKHPQLQG
jgi:hypothetical protein